jgi:hypothetical protein
MKAYFYNREPATSAGASIGGIALDDMKAQSESVKFSTSFVPDTLWVNAREAMLIGSFGRRAARCHIGALKRVQYIFSRSVR